METPEGAVHETLVTALRHLTRATLSLNRLDYQREHRVGGGPLLPIRLS
jgi:hypothetical protein